MKTTVFYLDAEKMIDAYRFANGMEPKPEWYRVSVDLDAEDPDDAFAQLNRGSGRESHLLDAMHLRSLSVGDVVKQGAHYFLCLPVGWRQLVNFGLEVRHERAVD